MTAEAVKVLKTIASKSSDVEFNIQDHDFGGIAIDNHGNPLPDSTLEACKKSDAILLGTRYRALPTRTFRLILSQ